MSALHKAAMRLYGRMSLTAGVARIELTASDLTIGDSVQLTLMSEEDALGPDQRRSLDASIAHIKEKYGIGAVVPGKLVRRAQRVDLWTYRLGHASNEPVAVTTDTTGAPARIRRASPRTQEATDYIVRQVQNTWRETDWSWGMLSEKNCYRVQTEPEGLYELHEIDGTWSLRALAD